MLLMERLSAIASVDHRTRRHIRSTRPARPTSPPLPAQPERPATPLIRDSRPPATPASTDIRTEIDLPGMEVLGFYDGPLSVTGPPSPATATSTLARRPATQVTPPPRPEDRAGLIQQLWDTTELPSHILDWWRPGSIARRKLGAADLRLSTIFWAGTGVVALIFAIWFFGARPGAMAEAAFEAVQSEGAALGETLPELARAAETLAGEQAPDLVGVTAASLATEETARQLFSVAGELPDDGEYEARRAQAIDAAGAALEAANLVGRAVAYRLSAEQILAIPSLPSNADPGHFDAAAQTLAAWRANVNEVVDDLPDDIMGEDRARLDTWRSELQIWQETYLDALSQSDAAGLAAAVTSQAAHIESLRSQLLADIARVGRAAVDLVGASGDSARALLAG